MKQTEDSEKKDMECYDPALAFLMFKIAILTIIFFTVMALEGSKDGSSEGWGG